MNRLPDRHSTALGEQSLDSGRFQPAVGNSSQTAPTLLLGLQQSQSAFINNVNPQSAISPSAYSADRTDISNSPLLINGTALNFNSPSIPFEMSSASGGFPLEGGNREIESTMNPDAATLPMSQDDVFWDSQFDFQNPDWLVSDDFDINALNSSITEISAFGTYHPSAMRMDHDVSGEANVGLRADHGCLTCTGELLRKRWYTHVNEDQTIRTRQVTPEEQAERTLVDETYRVNLSRKLQPSLSDDPLPSTEFLVSNVDPNDNIIELTSC